MHHKNRLIEIVKNIEILAYQEVSGSECFLAVFQILELKSLLVQIESSLNHCFSLN